MTHFNNPITLIRQLKGSPLAVLLALAWTRTPVTATWLCTVTGYADKPITRALSLLEEYQYISRVNGGWMISQAIQLSLPVDNPVDKSQSDSEVSRLQQKNRKKYDISPSSSCSSLNRKNIDSLEEEEEQESKNRIYYDNLKALQDANISEPACSRLARLPHVNPDLIRLHIFQALDEGHKVGTAIYRIEHKWSPDPATEKRYRLAEKAAKATGHGLNCDCIDCKLVRKGDRVCPDCRHVYCQCPNEDDESDAPDTN